MHPHNIHACGEVQQHAVALWNVLVDPPLLMSEGKHTRTAKRENDCAILIGYIIISVVWSPMCSIGVVIDAFMRKFKAKVLTCGIDHLPVDLGDSGIQATKMRVMKPCSPLQFIAE